MNDFKSLEKLTNSESELLEMALRLSRQYNLFFEADLFPLIGLTEEEYNNNFPPGSEHRKKIAQQIQSNRLNTKNSIRKRMFDGTGNILADTALYKLLATDEEFARMSNDYAKLSEKTKFNEILNNMDDDEIAL